MNTVKAKIKTIMLGDQSTGKTSMITRFVNNKFAEGAQATIGIDFLSRNLVLEGSEFRIQLWDTAGQERFRSLIPSYLKEASIVVIVFDVSNRKSYEALNSWFDLERLHHSEKSFCVLVGNKSDLCREVSVVEGQSKAAQHSCIYMQTSAKTGQNVQNLFMQAVKHYRDNLFTGTANTIVTQYDMSNSVVMNIKAPENKTSIVDVSKFKIQSVVQETKSSKRKCC